MQVRRQLCGESWLTSPLGSLTTSLNRTADGRWVGTARLRLRTATTATPRTMLTQRSRHRNHKGRIGDPSQPATRRRRLTRPSEWRRPSRSHGVACDPQHEHANFDASQSTHFLDVYESPSVASTDAATPTARQRQVETAEVSAMGKAPPARSAFAIRWRSSSTCFDWFLGDDVHQLSVPTRGPLGNRANEQWSIGQADVRALVHFSTKPIRLLMRNLAPISYWISMSCARVAAY